MAAGCHNVFIVAMTAANTRMTQNSSARPNPAMPSAAHTRETSWQTSRRPDRSTMIPLGMFAANDATWITDARAPASVYVKPSALWMNGSSR